MIFYQRKANRQAAQITESELRRALRRLTYLSGDNDSPLCSMLAFIFLFILQTVTQYLQTESEHGAHADRLNAQEGTTPALATYLPQR